MPSSKTYGCFLVPIGTSFDRVEQSNLKLFMLKWTYWTTLSPLNQDLNILGFMAQLQGENLMCTGADSSFEFSG